MSTRVSTLLNKESVLRHVLIMKVINKVGALSSITNLLAKHGINITGILGYVDEYETEGFMIMLVDKIDDTIVEHLRNNEYITYISYLTIPANTKFEPIIILSNSFSSL